jgi:hypothetical protein
MFGRETYEATANLLTEVAEYLFSAQEFAYSGFAPRTLEGHVHYSPEAPIGRSGAMLMSRKHKSKGENPNSSTGHHAAIRRGGAIGKETPQQEFDRLYSIERAKGRKLAPSQGARLAFLRPKGIKPTKSRK